LNAVYVETSAVLRWLFGQERADRVASFFEAVHRPLSSVLTILEARRAIVRASRERRIQRPRALQLERLLTHASETWTLLEITEHIRFRAARPFPVEPVRTLDAIHLSTSLEFAQVFPNLSVLSFDDRILDNLEPLGLVRAAAGV